MPIRSDPEGAETAALDALAPDLPGCRVLEIGCGDGRLTRRYAARAGAVLAIDPDASAISRFREAMPASLRDRVELRRHGVGDLDVPDAAFGLVLLSWSL